MTGDAFVLGFQVTHMLIGSTTLLVFSPRNGFFRGFRKVALNSLLIIISLFSTSNPAFSQSKKELERKKAQLHKDIEYTNQLLKQTRKNKSTSLNQLVTLNKKINYRTELIQTINGELTAVEGEISNVSGTIDSLNRRLNVLKVQYAEMLVAAYKSQGSMSQLTYIFAADDVQQAFKRIKYLQRLSAYRMHQRELIVSTQESLSGKKRKLQEEREDKTQLLVSKEKEKKELDQEKRQQVVMLNKLSSKEKKLRAELKKKQSQEHQLSARIEEIIRREIELARAQTRKQSGSSATASTSKNIPSKTEKASTPYVLSNTPETIRLSNDFESNRGRLPWPVEKGIISGSFGKHKHPVYRDVTVNNNGVNIASAAGAKARAVFEGKVTRVLMVVDKYAVLIQHGEYFTLYSNLESVSVKAGDRVSTKQVIGTVMESDSDGKSEVHLEIWKGSVKMNPEAWLAAR